MSKLPGVYTQEYEDRLYLVNDQGLVRGQDVVLDYRSSSPITPAHRVLPGTVIVKWVPEGGRVANPAKRVYSQCILWESCHDYQEMG